MPLSLGSVFIKAGKSKNTYYIDFKTSKEVGKPVKFLNRHTLGYYFMYYWDKGSIRFRNMSYYRFKGLASREAANKYNIGTRALGQHIKAKANDPTQKGFIRI
jgi:hypothetical protein